MSPQEEKNTIVSTSRQVHPYRAAGMAVCPVTSLDGFVASRGRSHVNAPLILESTSSYLGKVQCFPSKGGSL